MPTIPLADFPQNQLSHHTVRRRMRQVMGKKNTTWGFWKWHSHLIVLFMAAVTVIIVTSTVKKANWMESNKKQHKDYSSCDMFSGRWVYDNSTRPLYSGMNCAYMNDEIACDKYGRNDTRYQRWRWQPHGCNLPRFDARGMLERLRCKRMVYVGDSLNRNQWVSMVCLLESSIDSEHKSFMSNGSLMSFRAEEFNVSVDFYWSPLLVESNCDDPVNHRISDRIMRAGAIEKHARHWTHADVLIFNSYLWWKKPRLKMKVLYGSFDDKERNNQEVEMIEGFELALKPWADWLELHVDSLNTKVFFMSLSPTHVCEKVQITINDNLMFAKWLKSVQAEFKLICIMFDLYYIVDRGEDWGMASNQNCDNETEPINKEGYTGRGSDNSFTRIVEVAIEGLKKKAVSVRMLNITQPSEYRKDGHPSIYRKQWDTLGEDQLANPSSYSDCTHWCLPGVPDVWNETLYAYVMSK